MGQTGASPFMECADSHWASLSGWTEDAGDLGDDEESDDDDEALSDDEDDWCYWRCDPRFGLFLRLRLGRHALRCRHPGDVTRDAASRHTTTNYHRKPQVRSGAVGSVIKARMVPPGLLIPV